MTQLFDLSGRVALVTGASRGIGEEIARVLAGAGAHVIVSSRNMNNQAIGFQPGRNAMSLVDRLHHYVAVMKSDFEASLDLLADDIVWVNLLPEHVPFGGTYRGKEEVIAYFGAMAETFVIGEHLWDEFDYIESGDTLVMVGFEKDGRVIPTGKVFDLHFVWVVKFNDAGQICYLREHNDTAAIGDAFRA